MRFPFISCIAIAFTVVSLFYLAVGIPITPTLAFCMLLGGFLGACVGKAIFR